VTSEKPDDGYADLRVAAKSLLDAIFAPDPFGTVDGGRIVRELHVAVRHLAESGSSESEIRVALAGAILGKSRR